MKNLSAEAGEQNSGAHGGMIQCPQCSGLGYITKKLRRRESKNRELNAHIRDIGRHRYGAYTIPDRIFDAVLEDFKKTDIWPRYSDPEPDYFTGEQLYRPKSRAHLTDKEVGGIVNWLEHWMHEKEIPSNRPVDNWQA
jgi:hypothetical protein